MSPFVRMNPGSERVAPENYAIIRHMALNVIKADTSTKASVKRKRAMAALSDKFRTTLIKQAFNLGN